MFTHLRSARMKLYQSFSLEQRKVAQKISNRILVRKVEPYYLLLIWPLWYIQAWDRKRQAIRFFRLDRIAACQPENEFFRLSRQAEFKTYAQQFFDQI